MFDELRNFEVYLGKPFLTGLEHLSEQELQVVKSHLGEAFSQGRKHVFRQMAEDHEVEGTEDEE